MSGWLWRIFWCSGIKEDLVNGELILTGGSDSGNFQALLAEIGVLGDECIGM